MESKESSQLWVLCFIQPAQLAVAQRAPSLSSNNRYRPINMHIHVYRFLRKLHKILGGHVLPNPVHVQGAAKRYRKRSKSGTFFCHTFSRRIRQKVAP